jgi:gliding motility-associated-like protein
MNLKEQSTVAMKKVRSLSIALLLLTLIPFLSRAQAPTVQDCLGAIPICQQIYTESQSPTGTGNYPNEVNGDFSCSLSESNSIWYAFTVNQSGNFGFLIDPNDRNDDYDWALFDITNATCADIYSNQDLLVSCNATGDEPGARVVCNGETGATGASLHNVQGPGCSFDNPSNTEGRIRYNALIPVTSGNTYVLMVNNYTGSTNGYSINFGISDAGVLDMEGPELQNAQFPTTCNQQTIALTFDENIQCGSLSAADFSLTGPNGENYDLALLPGICNTGATYAREFTLEVEQPIVENGTYTFTMTLDGSNDILDNCNNAASGGVYTYNFEMNAPGLPVVELGDDRLSCDGQPVVLDAAFDQSTYRWQDGSTAPTFSVTQTGTYRVTVTNACGETTDEVTVTWLDGAPSIDLGPDTVICASSAFTLNATSAESTYLWQDGSTGATLPVTAPGMYGVTVTNACGQTTDQITIEFVNNAPGPDFGDDIVGCGSNTYPLDATSERATYLWQDGSTDPIFNAGQSGLYSVTVTNACGQAIEEIEIALLDAPPVVEFGPDTVLCTGANFVLDAASPQSTYLWQDGSTNAAFPVTTAGTYEVTVTNACGPATDQITVEFVREAPQTNLGDDITGCQGETFTLDATAERATYRWQDGSTDAVFNATQSGTYSVTVANVCGQITDEIEIDLLDGPPVFDLGQDTVLCTGANLTLDAASPQSTYLWQDGSTNAAFPVTAAGTYEVTVTNACGPTTDQITVDFVREAPQPDLGDDIVGCQGETFALDATSERATYLWQDGSANAVLNATQAGIYTVTVTNVCGQTTEEIEIELLNGPPVFELGPDTVLCAGVNFVLDAGSPQSTYQWQDGSANAAFPVTTAGIYEVTVTNACGPTTDQITVEFVSGLPQPDLGEDIFGCVGQSFTLDATSERSTYLWQDGSTGAVFTATQAGIYSVTATNVCGETSEEIEITLLDSSPTVELGQDSVLCSGDNFQLDVTSLGGAYLWQDGSTSAIYPVNTGGTYAVTVTNACGPTTDAVTYEFVSGPPRPDLGDSEVACIGETFLLDATSERATYEWQDGSTGATLNVDQSGLYQVTATNVCGQGSAQVQITFLEGPPVIDLGPDQIKCEGESLQLSAASDEASYNWSNGANTASITISTSNTYRVSVTNACGQVTDEIEVNFIPKIEVDLGEEQYLCEENFVLDATTHDFVTHRWQDGSTNPIYPVSEPGLYSVEIISACETVVDSVLLIRCENCDVYMPNAFSPNGDGQNDLFQPYTGCELMDFTFRVFDRWGTLVFESTDPLTGWDGRYNGQILPNGVYVWMIQYTVSENGEIFSENAYGDVAILR